MKPWSWRMVGWLAFLALAATVRPAYAQQAVLPLTLELDLTSDWTSVELRGLLWRVVERTVTVQGDAVPEVLAQPQRPIQVRKPPSDTTPVRVRFELLAVADGEPLQLVTTRGDVGGLSVRLRAGRQLLVADEASGRLAAAGNQRLLSVSRSQLRGVSAVPRRDWGRRMLAFYYGWWGTPRGPAGQWLHWEPEAPHHGVNLPAELGLYDSADPQVIAQHVAWAKAAGIDTLVLSLWRRSPHQDLVLKRLLDAAQHEGLTVAGYLESCDHADDLRQQMQSLLRDFGQHPAWLTVQGQKVLFIYTRIFRYVDTQGFRKALRDLPILAVGDRMEPEWLEVLGGLHSYVSFISPANTASELRLARQAARLHDKLAVATLMPGYDDTNVRYPGRHIPRDDGRYLAAQWAGVAQADWVILTSFNELHEGSQIEPTVPQAVETLQRMRAHIDAWKRGAP